MKSPVFFCGLFRPRQASEWQVACSALSELDSLRLEADAIATSSAIAACARGFAWPKAVQMLGP